MKKILGILMSATLMLSAAACNKPAEPAAPAAVSQTAQKAGPVNPEKILIAYYSYSGNTQAVAKQIAEATGGTLFQITTSHKYPQEYSAHTAQAQKELDNGFRPELTSKVKNMAQYDMVFVGSPNWRGSTAPAVKKFLESYDFKGKTVVPFFTNNGGGMQNCEIDMKKQLPDVAFAPAVTFPGRSLGANKKALASWLSQVGDFEHK